jgi:hypothetical protein
MAVVRGLWVIGKGNGIPLPCRRNRHPLSRFFSKNWAFEGIHVSVMMGALHNERHKPSPVAMSHATKDAGCRPYHGGRAFSCSLSCC